VLAEPEEVVVPLEPPVLVEEPEVDPLDVVVVAGVLPGVLPDGTDVVVVDVDV